MNTTKNVLTTGTKRVNDELAISFAKYGYTVVAVPLVETVPIVDVRTLEQLMAAIARGECSEDLIVITSTTTVEILSQLNHGGLGILTQLPFAVVGEKTLKAVEACGGQIYAVGKSGQDLFNCLQNAGLPTGHIWYIGALLHDHVLEELMLEAGKKVVDIALYKTITPEGAKKELMRVFAAHIFDAICFFSPSAVHNFVELNGQETVPKDVVIGCIGETTFESVKVLPHECCVLPASPSAAALADALVNCLDTLEKR